MYNNKKYNVSVFLCKIGGINLCWYGFYVYCMGSGKEYGVSHLNSYVNNKKIGQYYYLHTVMIRTVCLYVLV